MKRLDPALTAPPEGVISGDTPVPLALTACEIDLDAILHNLSVIRSQTAAGLPLMAVVKADAYGHGAAQVASCLESAGVASFAVATVEEGVALRRHGITARILVLVPALPVEYAQGFTRGLTLSVPSLADARLMAHMAFHLGCIPEVHLMVDMGLSRGGFSPAGLRAALPELRTLKGLSIDGIWAHFASVASLPRARENAEQFRELTRHAQRFLSLPLVHMASSAATFRLPEAHLTMVRPGLALYGYLPNGAAGTQLLRPAMRVTAPIVAVSRCPAGATVSYEGTYTLHKDSNIAVVRCGYADGYDVRLGNAGEVAIEGRRYPVAGRVTMDQLLVDLGDDEARIGARAVLLGAPGPSAPDLASRAGLPTHCVLATVGGRTASTWIGGQIKARGRCEAPPAAARTTP